MLCLEMTRFRGTQGLSYMRRVRSCRTINDLEYCHTNKFERIVEFFENLGSCAMFCRKLGGNAKEITNLTNHLTVYVE